MANRCCRGYPCPDRVAFGSLALQVRLADHVGTQHAPRFANIPIVAANGQCFEFVLRQPPLTSSLTRSGSGTLLVVREEIDDDCV